MRRPGGTWERQHFIATFLTLAPILLGELASLLSCAAMMRRGDWVQVRIRVMGIIKHLFELLRGDDAFVRDLLLSWAVQADGTILPYRSRQ